MTLKAQSDEESLDEHRDDSQGLYVILLFCNTITKMKLL